MLSVFFGVEIAHIRSVMLVVLSEVLRKQNTIIDKLNVEALQTDLVVSVVQYLLERSKEIGRPATTFILMIDESA
jgi:hypothetical protein